jgi:hypothetical protein
MIGGNPEAAGRLRAHLAGFLVGLGGLFVLVGGIILAFVGTVLATVFGILSAWFFVGVLDGIGLLVVGALLWAFPRGRTALGIAAIVLAAVSVPFAFGGFVVGFLLVLAGGAFAIGRRRRPIEAKVIHPRERAPPWG